MRTPQLQREFAFLVDFLRFHRKTPRDNAERIAAKYNGLPCIR